MHAGMIFLSGNGRRSAKWGGVSGDEAGTMVIRVSGAARGE